MSFTANTLPPLALRPGLVHESAAVLELARAVPYTPVADTGVLETLSDQHGVSLPDGPERDSLTARIDVGVLPREPLWIALHRYAPGDYALPHRLRDRLPGASDDLAWVVVCTLTGAAPDGCTVWDGERFVRVADEPGLGLQARPDTWCWTSPVLGDTRYTLTLGGRRA